LDQVEKVLSLGFLAPLKNWNSICCDKIISNLRAGSGEDRFWVESRFKKKMLALFRQRSSPCLLVQEDPILRAATAALLILSLDKYEAHAQVIRAWACMFYRITIVYFWVTVGAGQ
jgi:hypothetical protein